MKILKFFFRNLLTFYFYFTVLDRKKIKLKYKSDLVYYDKSEQINFNHPNYNVYGEAKLNYLKFKDKIILSKPFFVLLKNSWATGTNNTPIFLDSKLRIILETIHNKRKYIFFSGVFKNFFKIKFLNKKKFKFKNKVISLANNLSDNKHHWLIESLPRLKFFYENNILNEYKYFINHNFINYQSELLKILGVKNENIINWDKNNYKINQLIVPSLRFDYYYNNKYAIYSHDSIRWLRKTLIFNSSPIENKIKINLFIKRKKNSKRCIKNSNEIESLLKQYNFFIVELEELNEKEIIQLFYNAKVVVASCGAALTNILYSKKLKIIELFPKNFDDDAPHAYYALSQIFNYEHHLLICDNEKDNKFYVDTKKLTLILDKII